MADLYQDGDHAAEALARRLQDDLDKAVYAKMIAIFADRFQLLENVLWELNEQRWIDTARGAQLDNLGAIVGESRDGRDDVTYRLWVRARAKANRSHGRPDDSLEILKLLVESTATVRYVDQDPRDAEYRLTVENTAVDLVQVKKILELVRPAGVYMNLISAGDATSFAFDGGPDGLGFGDGTFASVV